MRIRIVTQLVGMVCSLTGAFLGAFKLIPFEDAVILLLFGIAIELFSLDN